MPTHPSDDATAPHDALEAFDRARPQLFGVAYRMLGSVAEAEDVVQDAWLRWQGTDRRTVHNPTAFLTTVVTRLAINAATSARARREVYVGPWLPEPVDTGDDPALGAERAEALDGAVLVLLERLPAEQRAAYVLREAFDYDYDRIGEVVETSPANARQLVSRARKHVRSDRRGSVDRATHRALLSAFVDAARGGDLARLEQVLATDVVSTSDGAGIAPRAARRPVVGRDRVARLVAGFAPDWWEGASVTWLETNGRPSVLVARGAEALAVLSIGTTAGAIDRLMWVMAPAKLQHLR